MGQHFSGTNFEPRPARITRIPSRIIVVNPNLDARRRQNRSSDYDAESGKATPGIVRGKRNPLERAHGSGFFYYRNSDQEARRPIPPTSPAFPCGAAKLGNIWAVLSVADHQDKPFLLVTIRDEQQQALPISIPSDRGGSSDL